MIRSCIISLILVFGSLSGSCERAGSPEAKCGDLVQAGDEDCDQEFGLDGIWGCAAGMACGNGALDEGEECDDGNRFSGDGCSGICRIEGLCGDGSVGPGEECDGSDPENGVSCDASCLLERTCGDGFLDPDEECDDGNLLAGDGCDTDCVREGSGPVCGNGILEEGEECDDGNNLRYDSCHQCRSLQTLLITSMEVAPAVTGWDFVDHGGAPGQWDCRVDNRLGSITEYGQALSFGMEVGIGGGFALLFVLDDLDDPLGRQDDAVRVHLFNGKDVDNNPDTSFAGGDHFYIWPDELTPAGDPGTTWTGSIRDGLLDIQTDRATLVIKVTAFTVHMDLARLRLMGTLGTDGRRIRHLSNAYLGVTFTARSMSQYPDLYKEYMALAANLDPNDFAGYLDLIVFGAPDLGYPQTLQPDVDLDGDGLERFEDSNPSDGVHRIDRCIDGDGTVIHGTGCVLDPRIQDGFSTTIAVEGIWARLAGHVPP